MSLTCVAWDAATDLFEFELTGSLPRVVVHRSMADLRAISRIAHKRGLQKMPSTAARNLHDCASWREKGEGWEQCKQKSLVTLNQWLASTLQGLTDDESADFQQESRHASRLAAVQERVDRERPARAFQQYFCSPDNAALLMVRLLQGLAALEPRRDVVVLEPSCGDGRVMEAIALALSSSSSGGSASGSGSGSGSCSGSGSASGSGRRVALCGIDLDPSMPPAAESRLLALPPEATASLHTHFIAADFLSHPIDVPALLPARAELPGADADDGPALLVVGCPPYTAGGGTGSLSQPGGDSAIDTGRDLPLRFLERCAGLGCERAMMLLPSRCGREGFVSRALELMQAAQGAAYRLECQCEGDPRFEFVGREVRQPALVQVYVKVKCV